MRIRANGCCGLQALLLAVAIMAGCSDSGRLFPESSATRTDPSSQRRAVGAPDYLDALRVRADARRNRLWVLALDEVRVYDTGRVPKRLLRSIALPSWSVIDFHRACMPEMVLDATGSAFISSNGQARLLRIDGEHFQVNDYAIHFPESPGRDSGFGALAFSAGGTLMARTTPDGLLWKIDINEARAMMAGINRQLPLDECAITTQLLDDAERSQQP